MRHASILASTALGLGSLLALSACDRSANAPASPRTSEIVHLSQAPVDAVPLSLETRPVPAAVVEKPAPDEDQTPETETPATPAPAPATTPPAPVVIPAPAQPSASAPQNPPPPSDVDPDA